MSISLSDDLARAHVAGVSAASAGLQDAQLGDVRLAGSAVPVLADAAVTSATPFLRAPLLSRISAALSLHPFNGRNGRCPTCNVTAPCQTSQELQW